jgi:hypothetical protein
MHAAVLQEMDCTAEIVVQEFLRAGQTINSRKDAGIRSTIENPVNSREGGKILLVTYITYPDIDAEGTERLQIGLAPLAYQAIDTRDPNIRKMLQDSSGNHGSCKSANSGNENTHKKGSWGPDILLV